MAEGVQAMFERFTDRARRVVVLAQEEAGGLKHNYIGTEHLLLGLIRERDGVAAAALESLGISLEAVRAEVEAIIGQGQSAPTAHIPFTPRAKKVLELSLREALQLGHNYIGTEHILLGLIREGDGVAAQVLVKLGGDLSRVRQQVIQVLAVQAGGEGPVAAATGPGGSPVTRVVGGPGVFREQGPPELVRVVSLAREVVRRPGWRLVLISLEVWSGWLDLRYALLALAPQTTAPIPDAGHRWRLGDDVGTAYELVGTTTGAGRMLHLHQLSFQPAPPEDATLLTLTLQDEEGAEIATAEIPLGDDEPA
jgi:Clp amino terminal domain, pathogenicity island component